MYDDNSFYYLAGLCFRNYYGNIPRDQQIKVVDKFKAWVLNKAGSDPLPTERFAVERIVKQFIFESKKGEGRGRYKH